MKDRSSNRKIAVYLTLALVALLLSTTLAAETYAYGAIVDGVLGLSNLFFIYILLIRQDASVPKFFDMSIEYPNDLKYIAGSFILWLIIYWSARHILVAISYIKNGIDLGS